MKKAIKIVLFLCALTLLCAVLFASCSLGETNNDFVVTNPIDGLQKPTDTSTNVVEETPLEKAHKELVKRLNDISYDNTYGELYSLYSDCVLHKAECGCEMKLDLLLNYMLLGEWKDSSGAIIRFTYIFTDYNDEKGTPGYETNLKTSKEAGKSYYYYFDYRDDKLIIGYMDAVASGKTENFILTFGESAISLESLIEEKTYNLIGNFEYEKVVKGKAKLAYEHISSVLPTFESPQTTKVTNCYVHYPNNHVYITIEYEIDGVKKTAQYEITIVDGEYQKNIFPYQANTNVDIVELNQMLKALFGNESNS